MSIALRWGRVSHPRTYGTPVKTATGKGTPLVGKCSLFRTMQERMFPIGTNLTQGNQVLVRKTESQRWVAGFVLPILRNWSGGFSM